MNKVKTIFFNASWMAISQVISSVLAFVWTLFTARYLGVNGYGIFGATLSLAGLFGAVCDVGTMYYAVREISVDLDSEQKYMDNCVSLRFILGAVYFALVILSLMVVGWNSYMVVICLIFAVHQFFSSFKSLLVISFQAHEEMKYQALMYIISNVLTFIFIMLVIFVDYGLFGIALAYVVANFIGLIYVLWILKKKFVFPRFSFDLDFYKILILGGLPFALNAIFSYIYYSIDVVMLTQMSNTYYVGLYNSAYKLVDIFAVFYAVYTATIFPVMSKLFKENTNVLNITLNKSIKYLSFITIPISVATLLYGTDMIVFCFGSKFSEAGSVLTLLVWSICFLFMNGATVTALNASNKERSVTIMYIFTSIFNIVFNLILIPKYNIYGAAVTTIMSDMFLLIFSIYVLYKIDLLPSIRLIFDLLKITVASSIMGICLYMLNLNMWFAIPVGIIIYLIVIIAIKFFDDDDKYIIRQVVGK
ncbi:flippase [uncultured Methanobrevibacter sp.]|uniref:flippase n=1 Tax=uncultured Methanobrevibacter sp. TaxID=253161 RepID=UPI0025FD73A8|nr:flippase [uncultured Methanobrevibacter sp.]